MSLRSRLAIIFSVLTFIAVLISGFILLSNARFAIKKEVIASRIIAQNLIEESLKVPPVNDTIENTLISLPHKFRHIRHVRISVSEPVGSKLRLAPTFTQQEKEDRAPEWFVNILKPTTEVTTIEVLFAKTNHGRITITSEPSDEIDEIWQDVVVLFKIGAITFSLLMIAIYVALGLALKPLDVMTAALKSMELGNFDVSIPPLKCFELTKLGEGINALSQRLAQSYKERDKLNHNLVSVQDDERRNIALELHDEFGPCHFGVKVNATSIAEFFEKQEGAEAARFAEKAHSILDIVTHMEACNRDLLNRLRPMALGVVDLKTLLDELVSSFQSRDETIKWTTDISSNLDSYGETIELTVYRIIQASLTNVLRHAGASEATVMVRVLTDPQGTNGSSEKSGTLLVRISDNGCGFSKLSNPGHGISGLEERIAALGGRFSISPNSPKGTIVEAHIFLFEEQTFPTGIQQATDTQNELIRL